MNEKSLLLILSRPYDALMHDFRSDTVTLPTPAMMEAIARARLGDAARGDDPTVAALEERAARLMGMDEALLLPSGAMANLAAVIAHGAHGGEVVVEADAHIYNSESGGLSVIAGAIPRLVAGNQGVLSPEALLEAIRAMPDVSRAPTALVCLENTHNAAGGTVYPLETLAAIRDVARRRGIPVHLDGARLFNAAAFLDKPIADICRHADSAWFSLCKGLGGPIGAVLGGSREFMVRARRAARMLGGGMRQAGIIAAPALVALEDEPLARHRRDHALARRLASGLARIEASLVDAAHVCTNIVNCRVDDAESVVQHLREHGVRALGRGRKVRLVTHAQVDGVSVEAAVAAFAAILGKDRTCGH